MKFARRLFIPAGLAVLVTAIGSTSARADMYGESSAGNTWGSQTVNITVGSTIGGTFNGGSNYITEYSTKLSNFASGSGATSYNSFCVDLLHGLSGSYTQLDNTPGVGSGGPLPLTNTFPTASNPDNGQVDAASFGRAAYIANNKTINTVQDWSAVQIAIWATEYGTGSLVLGGGPGTYTLTHGNIGFNGNSAAIQEAYNLLVLDGSNTASAYWVDYTVLTGSHQQQQLITGGTVIIQSVPEPSTMAIAGLGALGFLGYSLRRRKSA